MGFPFPARREFSRGDAWFALDDSSESKIEMGVGKRLWGGANPLGCFGADFPALSMAAQFALRRAGTQVRQGAQGAGPKSDRCRIRGEPGAAAAGHSCSARIPASVAGSPSARDGAGGAGQPLPRRGCCSRTTMRFRLISETAESSGVREGESIQPISPRKSAPPTEDISAGGGGFAKAKARRLIARRLPMSA